MSEIFTNEEEVVGGLRSSAEALGIDPNKVISKDASGVEYFAKKNCKNCWGQGLVIFVPSSQKSKDVWINSHKIGRVSARKGTKRGPTKPQKKLLVTKYPSNLFRETRRPEGPYDKERLGIFCRCVRIIQPQLPTEVK